MANDPGLLVSTDFGDKWPLTEVDEIGSDSLSMRQLAKESVTAYSSPRDLKFHTWTCKLCARKTLDPERLYASRSRIQLEGP